MRSGNGERESERERERQGMAEGKKWPTKRPQPMFPASVTSAQAPHSTPPFPPYPPLQNTGGREPLAPGWGGGRTAHRAKWKQKGRGMGRMGMKGWNGYGEDGYVYGEEEGGGKGRPDNLHDLLFWRELLQLVDIRADNEGVGLPRNKNASNEAGIFLEGPELCGQVL